MSNNSNQWISKSIFILLVLSSLPYLGCKPSQDLVFHDYLPRGEATPWTHLEFDDQSNKFMFAIISDLYGGEREGIYNVAIQQLNLLRPEFILSVGDLIDGGTEDLGQLKKEWDRFSSKTSRAEAPFFRLPGNHDITNMTMRNLWMDSYGARYYHFIYKDVLFLILDSEDYDPTRMQEIYLARAEAIKVLDGPDPSKAVQMKYFRMEERRTGNIGSEQSEYVINVLEKYPNVRWTFILMHKPLWMKEGQSHFQDIEKKLIDRPYTVINGHFHTYSHNSRNNRDYIMLGTTGGSQNDQSDKAFDHFMVVTMTREGPSIANIKMQGLLDKTGHIPANGDTLCYQASLCKIHEEK